MLAIKDYKHFEVDKIHQVLRQFLFLLLLKVAVVEDEEEAKLRAEAEKIGILAAVNTDANVVPSVLPGRDLSPVPDAEDRLSI